MSPLQNGFHSTSIYAWRNISINNSDKHITKIANLTGVNYNTNHLFVGSCLISDSLYPLFLIFPPIDHFTTNSRQSLVYN